MLLFSHPVVFNSLRPHGLKHDRLPCPSLSPRVCSDSCTWIQWCYLAISSSATHFSFCLQSFPASRSFPMSWLFAPRSQSTGTSASVLPMIFQDWFSLGLSGWISLQSMGLSRVFSNSAVQNISSSALSLPYGPTLTFIHDYWKNHSFDYVDLCQQNNVSSFSYSSLLWVSFQGVSVF